LVLAENVPEIMVHLADAPSAAEAENNWQVVTTEQTKSPRWFHFLEKCSTNPEVTEN
jgi:hypothetical protein